MFFPSIHFLFMLTAVYNIKSECSFLLKSRRNFFLFIYIGLNCLHCMNLYHFNLNNLGNEIEKFFKMKVSKKGMTREG